MTTQFIPLSDRVLVEPLEESEISKGGIIIPESAVHKLPVQHARVVAVGEGALLSSGERSKPQVKIDDVVVFYKQAAHDVEVNLKTYKLVCEKDILGIIEETGE